MPGRIVEMRSTALAMEAEFSSGLPVSSGVSVASPSLGLSGKRFRSDYYNVFLPPHILNRNLTKRIAYSTVIPPSIDIFQLESSFQSSKQMLIGLFCQFSMKTDIPRFGTSFGKFHWKWDRLYKIRTHSTPQVDFWHLNYKWNRYQPTDARAWQSCCKLARRRNRHNA